jgi:hypothetical protein
MTVAVTACGSAPVTVRPAASATSSASGSAVSGSPAASPGASSSPAPVPTGYRRVGGAAQGISIAAPASWVAIDPSKESIESAISKLSLSGTSASALTQDVASLGKADSVVVVDVKSGVDNPRHFFRSLNAFCTASGVNNVGAAAVQLFRTAAVAEVEKFGATHIAQQDLDIGGVPGVETSFQLSSSGVGTIDESQLEVAPKPNDACSVTLAVVPGESAVNILGTAAATAQFP